MHVGGVLVDEGSRVQVLAAGRFRFVQMTRLDKFLLGRLLLALRARHSGLVKSEVSMRVHPLLHAWSLFATVL